MLFPFHDDQPTTRLPLLTVAIIVINVVVFLGTASLDENELNDVTIQYGFVPARLKQLFGDQQPVTVEFETEEWQVGFQPQVVTKRVVLPPSPGAVALSLLTMMFLHGGILHLAGNMWFFWLYGNNIEDRLGHVLFGIFYLTGGLIASLCHWAVSSGPEATMPTIGASGAVAAVLGAYAVTYPWARVRTLVFFFIITIIELPALVVLGFWFLGELVSGLVALDGGASSNVAFWAHIGGFAFGAVVMPVLCRFVPEITPPALPEDPYSPGYPHGSDWERYPQQSPPGYGQPGYGQPGYGFGQYRTLRPAQHSAPLNEDDVIFLDEFGRPIRQPSSREPHRPRPSEPPPGQRGPYPMDDSVRRVVDDSVHRHEQDIRRQDDIRFEDR